MKQLLIKYAPILIALTALADTQFEVLLQIGLTSTAIAWIKLTGLLLALYLPSVSKKVNSMAREFNPENQTLENSDPIRPGGPKTRF
jgi:hypothetical protein